jgi:excisionase family DNA binding protein
MAKEIKEILSQIDTRNKPPYARGVLIATEIVDILNNQGLLPSSIYGKSTESKIDTTSQRASDLPLSDFQERIEPEAPPDQKDPLLRPQAAAEYLGIHRNTLIRWSEKGIIPHFRVGKQKHRRFRQSDLEAAKDYSEDNNSS